MPSNLTIFFDSPYFCTATAIFQDADLTIYAVSGYYAYQSQKRFWNASTKVLGPCENCS